MEARNHYTTLGIRPDATHREIVHAFARLAEHYSDQAAADPSAREHLENVKAAYETLTDYDARLRYNIERGLPDPPRHVKGSEEGSWLGGLATMIPSNWYVYAFLLVGLAYGAARIFKAQWMWDHVHNLPP